MTKLGWNDGDHSAYLSDLILPDSDASTLHCFLLISFDEALLFLRVLYYFNRWPVECVYFKANYLITYLRHISGIGNKGTFKWRLRKWRAAGNGLGS